MPVTKTAKRALRSSKRKENLNKLLKTKLDVAIRLAKGGSKEKIREAISLTDRAAKKNIIHKNKAARIKSALSKYLPRKSSKTSKK
ncbi:MAG: 30S ribosomal protein S20 [Patescibacteria group bacterium]|jgi:small subunit ribosomal protein S20